MKKEYFTTSKANCHKKLPKYFIRENDFMFEELFLGRNPRIKKKIPE